ncbi:MULTISPECIES: hypothetical protein [Rufibacter]|uniref:Uncharacterized protein n=1 Tax=Rufibacter quisquiliarum TaxID=1549639 RepID=A0A839GM32_9BACT|nr:MULTISPECIES: hypothetical protein [Rufibacter]MBA9075997.1 hypothetical protein [Rufibacter quisquiliarum]
MKRYIYGILVFLLASCQLEKEEITSITWKYSHGYRLGDILHSDNLKLQHDTLIFAGKRKAVVKEAKTRFDGVSELHIESLEGKEPGHYVSFKK